MESEKHKKLRLINLLKTFESLENRIEKDAADVLLSDLLSIDFFYNNSKVIQELTKEERDQLKAGKGDKEIQTRAENCIFPLLRKGISKINQLLSDYNSKDQLSEQDRAKEDYLKYLNQIEKIKQGDKQLKLLQNNEIRDIYNSYFSRSALLQMTQHLHTGNNPSPIKRYLTVCFLDLVGFSTMSENIDPEQVVNILNSFFNQVNLTIQKHKGDIDKFIGDAMLIIFETAEDAVRCSIEILLKDLDIINSKLEYLDIDEIKVHLGLNTGWVVQGNIGSKIRRETTVIGDGVNIAARVEGLSPPNELWLTESTMEELGEIKTLIEPVGYRRLKGRTQEVMVYKHVRKIPPNSTLLIYEPNEPLHKVITGKLNKIGIKNIIITSDIKQFKTEIQSDKIKAVVTGPSIETSVLDDILNEANRQDKKIIPTVPVLANKGEKNKIPMYERLGLKVYVSLYRDRSMEKISNVLINENIKDIPKLDRSSIYEKLGKKVHTPFEHKERDKIRVEEKIEGLADLNEIANILTEHNIQLIEHKDDKIDIPEKKDIEKGLQTKVSIHASQNEIKLVFESIITIEECELLKKNIINLWKFSFQERNIPYIFNLTSLKPGNVTSDFLNNLLKILDFNENPRKVDIKIEFPNNNPIANWEDIKTNFKYKFYN
ncbi:MAG: adenylate/guanylate cyclase domain-containing protein [Spirochaetota bacterium]|nr:adenylate/guanylate cyclase domain-containing protein [Spirochaetota bacterium]